MNMNKAFNSLTVVALSLLSVTAVSCSENDTPEPVVNHIYLQVPDGNNSIMDGTDEAVTIQVNLSRPVENDETFTFSLEGADAGLFVIDNNPVTISAGSTTGFFTVRSANKLTVTEAVTASFTIPGLDNNKFDIAANSTIRLLPAPGAGSLSPDKLALIAQWKEKYGIDLLPWIGNIRLQGTLEFPGDGNREAFITPGKITLSGFTGITISDEATSETPGDRYDRQSDGYDRLSLQVVQRPYRR